MKRLLLLILLFTGMTAGISSFALTKVEDEVKSTNGKYSLYHLSEDGIHYYYIYGPVYDIDKSLPDIYAFQFLALCHETNIEVPEVVTIPTEFEWEGKICKVEYIFNHDVPYFYAKSPHVLSDRILDTGLSFKFNKIIFPKEISLPTLKPVFYGEGFLSPDIRFIKHLESSSFIVDEENPSLKAEDGVLMTIDGKHIIRYPIHKKAINYYIPDHVEILCTGSFNGISIPIFLHSNITGYFGFLESWYPFYGLYDRTGVCNHNLYLSGEIRAMENISTLSAFPPECIALSYSSSADVSDRNKNHFTVFFEDEFSRIYDNAEPGGYPRIVEFKHPAGTILDFSYLVGDDVPSEDDVPIFEDKPELPKVVTYVNEALIPQYEEKIMKKRFPQNVIIEPTKNFLYLYPELCHGPWVNSQTQFIHGLCRFGEAQLVLREWVTDNPNVATIDETGVLTAYCPGEVTVTLTCTDSEGNKYTATQHVEITEEDFKETGLNNPLYDLNYPSGVHNLQGIKVGETTEGLPAGIYISEGRKIVVR